MSDRVNVDMVLCHGGGGRPSDLISAAEEIQLAFSSQFNLRILIPYGPIRHTAESESYYWWDIQLEDLLSCLEQKTKVLEGMIPQGLSETACSIALLLQRSPDSCSNVVLCGFSQGTSVCLELASCKTIPVRGICVVSPLAIALERVAAIEGICGVPVLIMHDPGDTVVSVDATDAIEEAITKAGADVKRSETTEGHEFGKCAIMMIIDFLNSLTVSGFSR
jgi:predicted esterase